MGRQILDPAHTTELETRAAIHEFQDKMPRAAAEAKAHDAYVLEHRRRAAAHHLDGFQAASAVGDKDSAQKHWLLYDLHMKALGHETAGPVPAEIKSLQELDDKKSVYRFKPHKGDIYSFSEHMQKAEHRCGWSLGERRCKNPGTRQVGDEWFCHHHEGHRQTRDSMKKSAQEVLQELYKSFPALVEDDMAKAEMAKVAPPGFSEETMHELKRKHGVESAFKIAWAAYKKNGKK
jgi:hypothetical protein